MRKPLFLYALIAAVLFVACSPEEQPAETDKAPSTDASEVEAAFPEGELTIDLDFNNKDKVWPFDEACFAKESQRAGGEKYTYRYR